MKAKNHAKSWSKRTYLDLAHFSAEVQVSKFQPDLKAQKHIPVNQKTNQIKPKKI